MRSDATRNATAVVDAARAVFADEGVDAPAKQITDAAGVGVGTLYRHFPRRSDLIVAVLQHEVDECIALAETLADAADPWDAVVAFVDRFTRFVGTKQGLAEALHSGDAAYEGLPDLLLGQLTPAFAELLARAVDSGAARSDVEAREVLTGVAMLQHGVPGAPAPLAPTLTRVFVDGLRTSTAIPVSR
ncbi:TetR/AcrR family transcriptional regulator [Frondihabitans australicus]|uniref:TetR family transcriptional regulator n=1 Tax=Frondihabitans australicus TaxID=386892 RepID=A0A495IFZ1_9MICO|nr:TetR/AcrR family transcriptional regulator [Frondihabitans australicus]RKR73986.1 TetR family transcriptional regulator [Frondihabitans australicus]